MKLYGEISKTEELDDGTIKVWGYASAESVDADGEIIKADAMKAAIPDYMKFGAVREMHQAKAAGTAIEIDVKDDGRTWFGAHVVDSEAVKKVKAKVYKGFSIGGKILGTDELQKNVITSLKLTEISLVDRPANPDATFTMYKADGIEKESAADDPADESIAKTGEGDPIAKAETTKAEQLDSKDVTAVDALADMLNKRLITPERLLELAKSEKETINPVFDMLKKLAGETSANPASAAEALEKLKKFVASQEAEELKKGVYTLKDFASALQSLSWICQDAEYDKQAEGDNSPVPAQLRDWLAAGVEIFKTMAAEELAEMLAMLNANAQKAAGVDDLAKAGAKFSKATKAALSKAHAGMKEACDHLDGLGYMDDKESADTGDDLAKVEDTDLELAKASGLDIEVTDYPALAKAALGELAKARTRITELEAQPEPGKAFLKAVEKSGDVLESIQPTVEPVKKFDGSVDETATLIKTIHKGGGRPYFG